MGTSWSCIKAGDQEDATQAYSVFAGVANFIDWIIIIMIIITFLENI